MERDALESRPAEADSWPDRIYDTLKAQGITQVAMVPDAGHARLIRLCLADAAMRVVTLTTEEEGVALLCGAWLGGAKGVLLMQSSGVGNCVNMLSMPVLYRCPLPMIVTMRGDFGEFNPAQVPMGQATQAVLEAMGTVVRRADAPADVAPVVEATLRLAFNTYRPTAALLGQRLLGAKTFGR
ncbi:MAG TPA: phosphonopyruvate decarboxylase [Acetobacteraceae bacterium]|jgi:sulfopyruvate decarboxylase alpha subunit|nr:phosphonopyruvate decarboxylase [Acetobacteraceae bacterium]